MDSVLIESPTAPKSPNVDLIFNPNFNSVLKESIDHFLTSIQTKTLDFSTFRSIFSRLLQSSPNPPLEITWFFSAISYHESLISAKTPPNRAAAIKNLIQLLEACSSSCSGLKSIALLAPAISELCNCVSEEKNISGKIEVLIERILGCISICSAKSDFEDFGIELLPCFLDLVRVWNAGKSVSGNDSGLDLFFPLVSEEIRGEFKGNGCGVGFLAGVVIAEAFLLRLWSKVRGGKSSKEELKVWAVSSVTVFRNPVFFEILLRLLLEPTLPVISLSDSKDENLVREILYDVVISVDYSFLNPATNTEQSYDFMRHLAVRRLMVTHDAIRIARETGNHGKAITYTSAFSSSSSLPDQIIKWVSNQTGKERARRPDVNTPQVVLEWLLSFEDQGLSFFVDDTTKLRTNLVLEESKAEPEAMIYRAEKKHKQTDADLFFIDNKGQHVEEEEETQPLDDGAFLAAARLMSSTESSMRKKRKESGGKVEVPVKFIKYKVRESSMKDYVSSGSEVDNPSDDEMEEK